MADQHQAPNYLDIGLKLLTWLLPGSALVTFVVSLWTKHRKKLFWVTGTLVVTAMVVIAGRFGWITRLLGWISRLLLARPPIWGVLLTIAGLLALVWIMKRFMDRPDAGRDRISKLVAKVGEPFPILAQYFAYEHGLWKLEGDTYHGPPYCYHCWAEDHNNFVQMHRPYVPGVVGIGGLIEAWDCPLNPSHQVRSERANLEEIINNIAQADLRKKQADWSAKAKALIEQDLPEEQKMVGN